MNVKCLEPPIFNKKHISMFGMAGFSQNFMVISGFPEGHRGDRIFGMNGISDVNFFYYRTCPFLPAKYTGRGI